MTPGGWWWGLGPASVELDCTGEPHVVRWVEGRLEAQEHADAEGERALAALAGERPACLELLELWARHEEDPRVLVVASRGASDPLLVAAAGGRGQRPGYAPMRSRGGGPGFAPRASMAYSSNATVHRMVMRRGQPGPLDEESDPLQVLAELAGPLFTRLAGTVAATWAARIEDGDERVAFHRAALDAAVYGRALLALRDWVGDSALEPNFAMIGPDDPPALAVEDGRITLALPFSWTPYVWARGLAVVLGRFAVAASTGTQGQVVLETVEADLSTRTTLTLAAWREPLTP